MQDFSILGAGARAGIAKPWSFRQGKEWTPGRAAIVGTDLGDEAGVRKAEARPEAKRRAFSRISLRWTAHGSCGRMHPKGDRHEETHRSDRGSRACSVRLREREVPRVPRHHRLRGRAVEGDRAEAGSRDRAAEGPARRAPVKDQAAAAVAQVNQTQKTIEELQAIARQAEQRIGSIPKEVIKQIVDILQAALK